MWTFSILIIILIFKINIIIIVIIRTGRRQRCLPALELLVKPRYPEEKSSLLLSLCKWSIITIVRHVDPVKPGKQSRGKGAGQLLAGGEQVHNYNNNQGASRFNIIIIRGQAGSSHHHPRCRCRQHHRHCHGHHPRNRWWWCSKVSNDSACFSPATRGNVFAGRPQTGKTLMIMIMNMIMMILIYNYY